jgi:hypothetical protein
MESTNLTLIELENKIKSLRIQMMCTAKLKGINHPDTIKFSQELDLILNEYQLLKLKD